MTEALPQEGRSTEDVQGHWLLARLGKRVLRPGGAGLTRRLLDATHLRGARVVEFAPGLGRTASWIVQYRPTQYTGVDADPVAAARVGKVVAGVGECQVADAAQTGLDAASADVVVGEAMLTMQTERGKRAIIAEAARILAPGGRYAIHELALHPDDLDGAVSEDIRLALARTIRVNARPLTQAQWRDLLVEEGFEIAWTGTAPMALLQMRRNLADEGLAGTARIVRNVLRDAPARKRVLAMRSVFRTYRRELQGVAIVAIKPVVEP